MRILVVDTHYPAFLNAHYAERPGLSERPYAEQLAALMDRCFGTSDAYSAGLRTIGHQAEDLVINCEPLQLRWATEQGAVRWRQRLSRLARGRTARAARRAVLLAIVSAQLDEYDPDVIYLQDLGALPLSELDRLRRRGCFVVGQIASPAPGPKRLRRFDLITTSFPQYVERFRGLGVDSEYLQIGFNTRIPERLREEGVNPSPDRERRWDVSFVGGIDPRIHSGGTALLERLSQSVDVDVWGYGADALENGSPILGRYHGQAWGLDMFKVLAESKITINRHVDAAEGYSNNMRLYEATGVGALLMTEASRNLADLFEPGREIVAYTTLDDLAHKIAYFLEHEDERRHIAAAGQVRTLSDHTYDRVISDLAGILERRLRDR
jgi:spore maturation protein CgeB